MNKMTLIEKIHQHVLILPEQRQVQVLDFVEYLLSISETDVQDTVRDTDDLEWSKYSLAMAMRGLEEEEELYTLEDLKEKF